MAWCTAFDEERNYCTPLELLFFTGMDKPCGFPKDPSECPTVLQMKFK